jgi:hypothetical protein
MPSRRHAFVLPGVAVLAVLQIVAAPATSRAEAGDAGGVERPSPAREELVVHVEDGRLAVRLRDAPLGDVLVAVGRASGVAVSLGETAPERVTLAFAAVPLEDGLRRILGARSFVLVYANDPRGRPTLARLRVLEAPRAAPVSEGQPRHDEAPPAECVTAASLAAETGRHDTAAVAPLARTLFEETEGSRRAEAAVALGRTWSPDAVAPLSQAVMEDGDASVRLAAVDALARTWDESAVDPLALALLGDPDAAVREHAARALGETWSAAAVEPLIEALLEDSHWQVRDGAARALGETGGAEAIMPLAQALHDDDGSVRESAALALAAIGDPQALRILARDGIPAGG